MKTKTTINIDSSLLDEIYRDIKEAKEVKQTLSSWLEIAIITRLKQIEK